MTTDLIDNILRSSGIIEENSDCGESELGIYSCFAVRLVERETLSGNRNKPPRSPKKRQLASELAANHQLQREANLFVIAGYRVRGAFGDARPLKARSKTGRLKIELPSEEELRALVNAAKDDRDARKQLRRLFRHFDDVWQTYLGRIEVVQAQLVQRMTGGDRDAARAILLQLEAIRKKFTGPTPIEKLSASLIALTCLEIEYFLARARELKIRLPDPQCEVIALRLLAALCLVREARSYLPGSKGVDDSEAQADTSLAHRQYSGHVHSAAIKAST